MAKTDANIPVNETETAAKPVKKSAPKKPNIFKRFGKKCKEVFAELKKVSWPSFGKVVKHTGVVLAVVAIFLIVFMGIDWGLSALLQLLG
ncbi:MAG: preprotein translocase subunit SecE [Bacillota bacterium]|nr:MAG: preprotein translocase subunit SecE [Bacillota bacterium]